MVCLITLLLENKLFDMFRKVVRPDGPELPSSVEVDVVCFVQGCARCIVSRSSSCDVRIFRRLV